MDIFTIYVTIGAGRMHLISVIFALISISISVYLLWGRYKLIYNLMISMLLTQFGTFSYDTLWKILRGEEYLPILGSADITFFLLILIFVSNWKFKFININKWTIVLLMFFIMDVGIMFYTGWFEQFDLFTVGLAPDPHNLVWAISKFLGFLIPVSLVLENPTKQQIP